MPINPPQPPNQPWERQRSESPEAYRAFAAYLEQPPTERNMRDIYRQLYGRPEATQPPGFFNRWAGQHRWRARAQEYDREQARVEYQAKMKVVADNAAKWERRRQQIAEQDFEDAQRLRERAREVMKLPIVSQTLTETQESPDGRTIINTFHVEPLKVRAVDAAAMLRLASDRQRLAAEMATQIVETITPENHALARLAEARKAYEDGVSKWPELSQQIAIDLATAYSDPHRGIIIQPEDLLPLDMGVTEIDGVQ